MVRAASWTHQDQGPLCIPRSDERWSGCSRTTHTFPCTESDDQSSGGRPRWIAGPVTSGRSHGRPRASDLCFGKFGWRIDPAGNRVELWEPVTTESEVRPIFSSSREVLVLYAKSSLSAVCEVLVLYLDRPLLSTEIGVGLGGAVRIQRLEGSRSLRGRCSMGVGWGLAGQGLVAELCGVAEQTERRPRLCLICFGC